MRTFAWPGLFLLGVGACGKYQPPPTEPLAPDPEIEPLPPAPSTCNGLHLELRREHDVFKATLINEGNDRLTLVTTGDGSESHMRTPFVSWKVTNASGRYVPESIGGRCGMVNSIRAKEVFELSPQSRHEMLVLARPSVHDCKPCFVRLTYENDPNFNLEHIRIEPKALDGIRQSSACRVESNALRVDL